jgi:hypothetical protein
LTGLAANVVPMLDDGQRPVNLMVGNERSPNPAWEERAMNRLHLVFAAALLTVSAGTAGAQQFGQPGFYNPYLNQPRLSPYLNIVRGGSNPAINYYLGTLPEVERRAAQAVYGNALIRLERQVTGLEGEEQDNLSQQGATGHPSYFANTGGYFPGGNPNRLSTGATQRPGQAKRPSR